MDTVGLRSRVPQTHVNSLTRIRPEQCFVCCVSATDELSGRFLLNQGETLNGQLFQAGTRNSLCHCLALKVYGQSCVQAESGRYKSNLAAPLPVGPTMHLVTAQAPYR